VPRPLIALVAYHLPLGRITKWDSGAHAVPDEYVTALDRAGGQAVLLTAPVGPDPAALLQRFDGLLLVGGGDVAPERFGATERHPELYGVNEDRDQAEVDLVLAADRVAMPTLAICRGVQVMNVAFGGTLHQHLPGMEAFDQHRLPAKAGFMHDVEVSESGLLAGATGAGSLHCFSAHHQGLDRLGEGLTPVAWAQDGLIEAAERPEGWMLGVQWHPERTAGEDPAQQRLFEVLVERAGG
jgi:putative glutamine amidotransferase